MSRSKAKKRLRLDGGNVVDFNNFLPPKQKQVTLTPRNLAQENYLFKLLDETKNIVFALGPAGTGKTLLACQTAVKLFQEGKVDKIVVTRPAVSADEDFFLASTASTAALAAISMSMAEEMEGLGQ